MIFTIKNHKNEIVSILSAKSQSQIRPYLQGAGIKYNSIEEFDVNAIRENEEMGYVTTILTTQTVQKHDLRDLKDIVMVVEN